MLDLVPSWFSKSCRRYALRMKESYRDVIGRKLALALTLESSSLEAKSFVKELAKTILGTFFVEPLIKCTVHTVVFPGPMPFHNC